MKIVNLTPLLILLMAVSCSREEVVEPPAAPTPKQREEASARELLVGSWSSPGGDMTFFADGSVSTTPAEKLNGEVVTLPGQWTLDNDGQLSLTLAFRGRTLTNTATVAFTDANSLELTDSKGVVDKMTRDKSPKVATATGAENAPTAESLIGIYGGERCIYERLEFKEGGKLYVKVWGMEFPATYQVDGNRVAFTDGQGRGIVFTRRGSHLDAGAAGVCTRQTQ